MATEADFKRIGNYARMHNPDQNVDHRHAQRTVPLEVLCLGYSRTGTLSMHKAMETLGYPSPFHFSSFYDNTVDAQHWIAAIDAKYNGKGDEVPDKAFFDGMLGHVGAVTDMPCCLFGEELINFYPDAKVVLVERPIDKWFESWMNFCQSAFDPMIYQLGSLDPDYTGRITGIGGAGVRVQTGFAENIDQARERSRDIYENHYRNIRKWTPPDRLLEFKLEDGWEPLCKFLGKPVPDVPFPHENDTVSNRQSFVELAKIAQDNYAAKAAGGQK